MPNRVTEPSDRTEKVVMDISRRTALVAFGAFASTAVGCCCAPTVPSRVNNVEQLETFLESLVQTANPPGMSLVVTKGDQIRYARGFGMADIPRQAKANPESVYNWWSLTKMFTVVSVLQLQEAKRLSIDDPVDKYLTFFKTESPKPEWGKVTIKHLLTHSSGLGDVGLSILGWIHHDPAAARNQTALIAEKFPDYRKLNYEPGTEGQYSNVGYMVLGALIERVSGLSYEDYVRQNILKPLGMNDTDFVHKPNMVAKEATGSHPFDFLSLVAFTQIDRKLAIREKVEGVYWFNHVYPDQTAPSGLIGSAADMAKFLIALQNDGSYKGSRILSASSIQLMNTPYVVVTKSDAPTIPGLKLGLGWFHLMDQAGRVALTHGGSGMGYVSMMRMYPKESTSVILMANSTYLEGEQGLSIVNLAGSLAW